MQREAIAAYYCPTLEQMDAVTAFVNPDAEKSLSSQASSETRWNCDPASSQLYSL